MDKSIYPESIRQSSAWRGGELRQTFFLVHTQDYDNLVAADSDQLLNAANATSGEFRKEDHSIDIVVFEELDVGTHVGDLDSKSAKAPITAQRRKKRKFPPV